MRCGMHFNEIPLLVLAAGLACAAVGCTVDAEPEPEPVAVAPAPVVVQPGYYYEPAYPRVYYYYDGHRYWHRDYVPRGYVAHEWHRDRDWHRDQDGWRRR